jgi:hypothetical protein
MKKTHLYLCGPMTGLPNHNRPEFDRTAEILRLHGYIVFTPTENGLPTDTAWENHMRADIRALMGVSNVAVMPGSEKSRGCKLELHIAKELNMTIKTVDQWIFEAAKK